MFLQAGAFEENGTGNLPDNSFALVLHFFTKTPG